MAANRIHEAVCRFLETPSTHCQSEPVEVIETHGARIFLARSLAYKIKRPVKYDYLDFSTLAKRRKVCQRELKINKPFAPDLYLGLVPITRNGNGKMEIDGDGKPVEWAIAMKRFENDSLLNAIAERGELDGRLAAELGRQVAIYHDSLDPVCIRNGSSLILEVLHELARFFEKSVHLFESRKTRQFLDLSQTRFEDVKDELDKRALKGMIRRCHGDLHMKNIVVLEGKPTLFDALEFDERLATTDVLYDLAFLIMDMWHDNLRAQANMTYNRYLLAAWPFASGDGLKVLPLFMSIRAAIRAMVCTQTTQITHSANSQFSLSADGYLDSAIEMLVTSPPVLLAVGGLSGTGKSTLASALASELGSAPGAVLLRSDLERKAIMGVDELTRLPAEAYTQETNTRIYGQLITKAQDVLGQGHSVVLDGVFSRSEERKSAQKIARKIGVPFLGIWLSAPADILIERVGARRGDASDATVEIVKRQLAGKYGSGMEEKYGWVCLDASGSPDDTRRKADEVLWKLIGKPTFKPLRLSNQERHNQQN